MAQFLLYFFPKLRSDSSSSVLLGMKSVVIACKTVTEDVEDYEHETNDKHIFADLKQELSSGLTQLMNSAKAHSNAFDEDEDEFDRSLNDLEAAADQLEAIVMDIVNVPKHNGGPIKESGHHGRDHHDDDIQHNNHDGHHGGPNGNAPAHNSNNNSSNNNNSNNNDDGPMDSQDLKVYTSAICTFITICSTMFSWIALVEMMTYSSRSLFAHNRSILRHKLG